MAGKILIGGSVVRALYGILALFLPKLLLAGVGMSEEEVGTRPVTSIVFSAAAICSSRSAPSRP